MDSFDEAHDALVEHRASQVVPAELPDGVEQSILLEMIEAVQANAKYFYCSLPDRTHTDKMKIARFLTSKDNDIEKLLHPASMPVADFILSKASFVDKDDKQVTVPKLVLIGVDGNSFSVMAKVFVVEFLGLVAAIGSPPWPEPIVVSCKLNKGNGTNRYYSLFLP